jgi:hypothetical protein
MESADGQPDPSMLLIRGRARWHPQECPSTVGLSRFDPKVEVELPWILGSTVIHLKVSTDLLTAFSTNETHVPLLQPPWEANQGPYDQEMVKSNIARRCPRSPDGPSAPNRLVHANYHSL